MATATKSTVIGLFQSRQTAEQAVSALVNGNFPRDMISVISSDSRGNTDIPNIAPIESTGSFDAGTGAAVGGLAGLVGGIIALAIPGIGPILAAGPLAAGIMGAGLGAATGGIIGGLKEHGVPENDAAQVAEAIRRGRVLVTLATSSDRAHDAAKIMDDNGAVDTEETEGATDPNAPSTSFRPVTREGIEAAKLRPGESLMDQERARTRRAQVFPGITGAGVDTHS